MALIIKRSMKASWNTKDWSKKPTKSCSGLNQFLLKTAYPADAPLYAKFPESEGDSRKLKKVQELVQHFCEQCRHYVPKQNIWWKFEID